MSLRVAAGRRASGVRVQVGHPAPCSLRSSFGEHSPAPRPLAAPPTQGPSANSFPGLSCQVPSVALSMLLGHQLDWERPAPSWCRPCSRVFSPSRLVRLRENSSPPLAEPGFCCGVPVLLTWSVFPPLLPTENPGPQLWGVGGGDGEEVLWVPKPPAGVPPSCSCALRNGDRLPPPLHSGAGTWRGRSRRTQLRSRIPAFGLHQGPVGSYCSDGD